MEIAALAIAILSLVLAALALGWQIAPWALDRDFALRSSMEPWAAAALLSRPSAVTAS